MDDFERVRELREEYEATLDEAEVRRTEYHAAIRKLYLAGTPLREIADRLGVSHQRVHEIVGKEPVIRRKKRRQVLGSAGIVALMLGMGALAWALIAYERPRINVPAEAVAKRCEDPCPGVRYWIFYGKQSGRILGLSGVHPSQNIQGSGAELRRGEVEKELTGRDRANVAALMRGLDQYYVDVDTGEIKRKLTHPVLAVTWTVLAIAGMIALILWNLRARPRPPRLVTDPALPS